MAEPWAGWSIRVHGVQIYSQEDERGCEGHVLYELTKPCSAGCRAGLEGENWTHSAVEEREQATRDLPWHTKFRYLAQPFHRGGQRLYRGATAEEIAENRANVWAWDGNREAPSLTPSYYFLGRQDPKGRYPDWPAVHIHLTRGVIVNSGCDAAIR